MLVSIDDYKEVKDCIYKEEHYSARDNGAVMRHKRQGMRKRKLDEVWSFGTPNTVTGYLDFCGERVHRIVATAFLGEAPGEQYVVDHIDTNRQNNRPENLRWLTKLENILCNEITRKKVELICGSIEAFLDNPQLLYGYEAIDKNFSWMRSVSKEEAQYCLAHWSHWGKTAKPNPNYNKNESHIGEWIYNTPIDYSDNPLMMNHGDSANSSSKVTETPEFMDFNEDIEKEEDEPRVFESLTPSAMQIEWRTPTEFPCCPQKYSGNPLVAYMANLEEGAVFCTNSYGDSTVLRFGMPKSDSLWVMCGISIGWKTHAFTKITFKDGIFYHENIGVYDFGDEPEKIFDSILKGEREI